MKLFGILLVATVIACGDSNPFSIDSEMKVLCSPDCYRGLREIVEKIKLTEIWKEIKDIKTEENETISSILWPECGVSSESNESDESSSESGRLFRSYP